MDKFEPRTNHRLQYPQFLSFLLFPFQITRDFFGIESHDVLVPQAAQFDPTHAEILGCHFESVPKM